MVDLTVSHKIRVDPDAVIGTVIETRFKAVKMVRMGQLSTIQAAHTMSNEHIHILNRTSNTLLKAEPM